MSMTDRSTAPQLVLVEGRHCEMLMILAWRDVSVRYKRFCWS